MRRLLSYNGPMDRDTPPSGTPGADQLRKELADAVGDARKSAGLTQKQCAARVGYNRSHISNVERNEDPASEELVVAYDQHIVPLAYVQQIVPPGTPLLLHRWQKWKTAVEDEKRLERIARHRPRASAQHGDDAEQAAPSHASAQPSRWGRAQRVRRAIAAGITLGAIALIAAIAIAARIASPPRVAPVPRDVCVRHPSDASVVCVRNQGRTVDACDRDQDRHRTYARVITDASAPDFRSPFYDDNGSQRGCGNYDQASPVRAIAVCVQFEGCSGFKQT